MSILENFNKRIQQLQNPNDIKKMPSNLPLADELLKILTDMYFARMTAEQAVQKLESLGIVGIPATNLDVQHAVTQKLKELRSAPIIASKNLKYEILNTSEEKAQGLQHRASLDPNTILVFTSIDPNSYFHSQNCKFAFDIAFLNKTGKILKAKTVYPPDEYIKAPEYTNQAVEMKAGFLKNYNLEIGDQFPLPGESNG